MLDSLRRLRYSRRAWLVAIFVAFAMVLGGGGALNPLTELVLEAVFALCAILWIWAPGDEGVLDPWVCALIAIPLIVCIAQLVPLPASIWRELPGRESEIAALQLAGGAGDWQPASVSPGRTLATLLAMIQAGALLYAVSRLRTGERRLVLGVIAAAAIVNGLFGMLQLTAGAANLNFYPVFSRGWVTGFQANRNHAADVLLIGILAVAALAAPYVSRKTRGRQSAGVHLRPSIILAIAVVVFLQFATVMTGSRFGIALSALTLASAVLMLSPFLTRRGVPVGAMLAGLVIAMTGVTALLALADQGGPATIGKVAARFSDIESDRQQLWQDTLFAVNSYWPVGSGFGTFEPVILAAERLEYVGPKFPNRAHNDFLELALEAGLPGLLALVAMGAILALIAARSWRRSPQDRGYVVFGITVLILIALHSTVDYPLRSMAVTCLVAIAGGMLTSTRTKNVTDEAVGRKSEVEGIS